jgi:hypothetical protein
MLRARLVSARALSHFLDAQNVTMRGAPTDDAHD